MPELYIYFFIINFPTFTYLYFKRLLQPQFSSKNGGTECTLFINKSSTKLFYQIFELLHLKLKKKEKSAKTSL